jgi:hypothetical protein
MLRKYKYIITAVFLGIFLMKMAISGAPLFFSSSDKEILNAVIMQVELEHGNSQDAGKDISKLGDIKFFGLDNMFSVYELPVFNLSISNSFIEHYKRYVDPHHPSVPTPPPNLV